MTAKGNFFILGTNHFDTTNNQDRFAVEVDVMSNERQMEMKEVLECLKKYKPTKIAVEGLKDRQEQLTESYKDYLAGNGELSRNEIHQIGFRLAEMMDHKDIYAVDWNEDVEGIPDLDEWVAKNPSSTFDEIMKKLGQITTEIESYFTTHSIRDFLLMLNKPERVEQGHEVYMKMALIGDEQHHVGAMWTGMYWYYRNMVIYKNLIDLVDSPDERILVIYGAGHLHLLKQYIMENGDYQLEDPEDYL